MQTMFKIKEENDEQYIEEVVDDELSDYAYDTKAPIVCSDLLRFDEVLFLDATPRHHNSYKLPNIAAVVKNHNVKIVQVDESIVASENLDAYEMIFRSMRDMRMVVDSESDSGSVTNLDICYDDDDDEDNDCIHDDEEDDNETSNDNTHYPFHYPNDI